MEVTCFIPPKGQKEIIELTNVYPEDELWFEENNIKISMENIGNDFIVYGDYGAKDEDDEPIEAIVISFNGQKTCEETLNSLRKEIEKLL